MERGLLWLPLLAIFFWLAWSGWNEYQKVEAYRIWAANYERTKYDIYSIVGQKNKEITWGKPTRSGPVDLQTFSLDEVEKINLLVDRQAVDLENPGDRGSVAVEFQFKSERDLISVPFTQISLAAEWVKYLRQELNKYE
ncbi:MAG: hypothetical protein ACFBSE_05460 [Prochloraceae cyanobacterium]